MIPYHVVHEFRPVHYAIATAAAAVVGGLMLLLLLVSAVAVALGLVWEWCIRHWRRITAFIASTVLIALAAAVMQEIVWEQIFAARGAHGYPQLWWTEPRELTAAAAMYLFAGTVLSLLLWLPLWNRKNKL